MNQWIYRFFTLTVLLWLFAADHVIAGQSGTNVDWIGGYVSAKARGFAKKTGSPIDRENAAEAAKVLAQAELLEAVKGVKVDTQTFVGDLVEGRTETAVRIQGVLRNAFQAGEPQLTTEGEFVVATVEMKICLYNEGLGCRADMPLVSILPTRLNPDRRPKSPNCNLAPDIISSRAALKKLNANILEKEPFFLINLHGKPLNPELRDIAIGFSTDNGERCIVYAPDKVDPLVRRDRGTVEIFLHESEGRTKYGRGTLILTALHLDRKNYITVAREDAYLMNLINESKRNVLFREGRVGIAVDN